MWNFKGVMIQNKGVQLNKKIASYAFKSTNKAKHSTHACNPRMVELVTEDYKKQAQMDYRTK